MSQLKPQGQSKEFIFTGEQLAAIESKNQFVLISAGAGSGKTTVMAERVAHFIREKIVAADEILGLTFTRFATAELQSRVRQRLLQLERQKPSQNALTRKDEETTQEESFDLQPAFHTYHSFAERILRENALRIGFEPDSIALTDVRRNQLAAYVIRKSALPLGDLNLSLSYVLKYVLALDANLSNNVISTANLREYDERLIQDLNMFDSIHKTKDLLKTCANRMILADLVDEFRLEKRVRSVFDYSDMARLALQILQSSPDLIVQYQKIYKQILLDEYQDTSISQRELLRLLFTSQSVGITAVGDPLQAIYGFQGGNIDNILNFGNYYASNNHHKVDLTLTQRNGKNILHLANLVGQPVREAYPEAELNWLVPVDEPTYGDGRVSIRSYATTQEEIEAIAREFKLLHDEGINFEKMAVLTRNRFELQDISRVLNELEIPTQIRLSRDLVNLPEIAEVISYLRIIAYPAANVDWLRILSGPRFALSLRDIAGIGRISQALSTFVKRESERTFENEINRAIEGHDQADIAAYGDVVDFLSEHDSADISQDALLRIRLLHADIEYLRQYTGENLPALVQRILSVSGLGIEMYSHNERIERGLSGNMQAFLALLSDFSSLQGSATIFDFLTWLSDSERFQNMVTIDIPERRGAVNLMTVHGSKGLQFRAVALPFMSNRIFPSATPSDRWTGSATAIPNALKNISQASGLADFPPKDRKIATKDHEAFAELCRQEDLLEERRLLYVALTRTQDVLLISHAYSDGSNERQPSKFFEELVAHAASEPDITVHEIMYDSSTTNEKKVLGLKWPVRQKSQEIESIRNLALQVRDLLSSEIVLQSSSNTPMSDWDTAITSLTRSRSDEANLTKQVQLPESLSASDIQRLVKDEQAFIAELVRPMPKAPHLGADMGTLFHEWIENYYRQRANGGSMAALPGIEDYDQLQSDILERSTLRELIDKFGESEWASKQPFAVEEPFTVIIHDRIVKGRIDAVFQDGDRWILVDWKTHSQLNADPLQLSIYRIAYAKKHDIPLERISAAFFYVRRNETVFPDLYLSEEQLTF